MAVNIAINGFGRVGRLVFCRLLGDKAFEIAAINDSAKPELLAYLLKHETPQEGRPFAGAVDSGPDFISIRGKKIKTYAETSPSKLPWKKLKVDLVLDCAGLPAPKEQAAAHLAAGAKKAFMLDGDTGDLPVIVYGINEKEIAADARAAIIPSFALSSLALLIKALNDFASIQSGILAAANGEAKAIGRIIPELQGKLADSGAGSATLLTAVIKGKNITAETINKALNAKVEREWTLVLPASDDLYQVQIAARYSGEDAYTAELVKILKCFAKPKTGGPAKPGGTKKTAAAPPVTKPAAKKPAENAKSAKPVPTRKPLINFPK